MGDSWLVDAEERTLEVYALKHGRWAALPTYRDEAVARIEPFDAIEFELAALWTV